MSLGIRGPKRDRGVAAAEFAVVVPLLLLLVFGIIDFGRMASDRIALTAAAHAAAQALAIGDPSPLAEAQKVFPGGVLTAGAAVSCPTFPTPGATASFTVNVDFKFATPVGVLANFGNPDGITMHATGVVPCRA